MKLLTKENLKKIPGIHKSDKELVAHVKFFTPWSNWTWYLCEYDPISGECFGLVQGFEAELGSWHMDELAEIRGPYGLKIERDKHFEATSIESVMNKQKKEA